MQHIEETNLARACNILKKLILLLHATSRACDSRRPPLAKPFSCVHIYLICMHRYIRLLGGIHGYTYIYHSLVTPWATFSKGRPLSQSRRRDIVSIFLTFKIIISQPLNLAKLKYLANIYRMILTASSNSNVDRFCKLSEIWSKNGIFPLLLRTIRFLHFWVL